MIGQKFVDAPQTHLAKSWGVQMGVNVDEVRGGEDIFHSRGNLRF
jgi:hypothetical protein